MSQSMFSGGIGIPHGAGSLMRDDDFVKAVQDIIRDVETEPTSTVRDWATFDKDGVEVLQTARNTMSCSHTGEGTYEVTCSVAGNFMPQATIYGAPSVEPFVSTINRQWFTTQDIESSETQVIYDPVKDVVWATDYDHVTSFSSGLPDRLAIGNMFAETPEVYLYLPSSFPILFVQNGDTLFLDLTYRIAFVQATSVGGTRTTLLYDMDSYALLEHSNTFTGGTQRVVVGVTDSRILIFGDTVLELWSRDGSGLFDTFIDSESANTAAEAIGFRWAIKTNDGHLWSRDSGAPADWADIDAAAGTLAVSTRDGGTKSISDRLYTYNPVDNCIYFLTANSSDFHLMKILTSSPYTLTQITSTAYNETVDANTADETIVAASAITFTPDYSRLVVIRGAGSTFPYFFLVDPSDGSIDLAFELVDEFASNYAADVIVSLGGVVATVGSFNLQIIQYTTGSGGSSLEDEICTIHTRMLDSTTALVETYKSWDPNKIKVDSGFHIEFVRDP